MVKHPPANAGEVGPITGLGRFPVEANGNPLQYSCQGNPMDRGAWQAMGSQNSPWGRKKLDMTYQLNNKHNPYLFDVLLLHLVLNFIRHFPA